MNAITPTPIAFTDFLVGKARAVSDALSESRDSFCLVESAIRDGRSAEALEWLARMEKRVRRAYDEFAQMGSALREEARALEKLRFELEARVKPAPKGEAFYVVRGEGDHPADFRCFECLEDAASAAVEIGEGASVERVANGFSTDVSDEAAALALESCDGLRDVPDFVRESEAWRSLMDVARYGRPDERPLVL